MSHGESTPAGDEVLLPVSVCCSRYALGRTTLYALIADGRITARKIGARTVIERASIDAWVATLPQVKITLKKFERPRKGPKNV